MEDYTAEKKEKKKKKNTKKITGILQGSFRRKKTQKKKIVRNSEIKIFHMQIEKQYKNIRKTITIKEKNSWITQLVLLKNQKMFVIVSKFLISESF